MSHGSQVLLRSDDHVGVLLLLAAVLRVHFEVHGFVEARVSLPDHLVPMEEPALAQRYACWLRRRSEHMVCIDHRAIDPSCWLIEIRTSRRKNC